MNFSQKEKHGKRLNDMTNLLVSIITVLVTNVSETTNERYEQYLAPCPDKMPGCCVIHGWIQGPKISDADRKAVTTTCHRITNGVSTINGREFSNELGRQWLWSTTESFALVKTWKSESVVTNPPPVAELSLTNSGYGKIWVATNIGLYSVEAWGNTISNLTILTNKYTLELR